MLLGHGLVVGFVAGVAVTLMVQRKLRKHRLKIAGAPKGILSRLMSSMFGNPEKRKPDKGGKN